MQPSNASAAHPPKTEKKILRPELRGSLRGCALYISIGFSNALSSVTLTHYTKKQIIADYRANSRLMCAAAPPARRTVPTACESGISPKSLKYFFRHPIIWGSAIPIKIRRIIY
jgi:hypothetical protein